MERLENVATPFTAVRVVVPASVPPPGLLPIAIVTFAVELVTVFPPASCTTTCTDGTIKDPAVTPEGCTTKLSCEAELFAMQALLHTWNPVLQAVTWHVPDEQEKAVPFGNIVELQATQLVPQ